MTAGTLAHAPARSDRTDTSKAVDARLAYLVLAHADPDHFGRLLRRLSDPRVLFVVHIDAKAALGPFQAAARDIPNVFFVEDRMRVMWAAFSQVQSTLKTMELALALTTSACSHFAIISGVDFPLACNDEIIASFSKHPRRQFIRRFDILNCGDAHQVWRVRGTHLRQLADRHTLKRRPLFMLERLLRLRPRQFDSQMTIAAGSNWCALTRDCVSYCVEFCIQHPQFIRKCRYMFGSDEIFFHTIVENSHFAADAAPIEPYVDTTTPGGPWHYGNLHALGPVSDITTAEQANALLRNRGGKLFARKFSSARSEPALAVIEAALASGGSEEREIVVAAQSGRS